MKHEDLDKFLARARRGRSDTTGDTPFGFAARVAARWASLQPSPDPLFLWERVTRWGLAGACAVCLTVFVASGPSLRADPTPSALEAFAGLADDDPL